MDDCVKPSVIPIPIEDVIRALSPTDGPAEIGDLSIDVDSNGVVVPDGHSCVNQTGLILPVHARAGQVYVELDPGGSFGVGHVDPSTDVILVIYRRELAYQDPFSGTRVYINIPVTAAVIPSPGSSGGDAIAVVMVQPDGSVKT